MILFEFQKDHHGKDARMLIRGNKRGDRENHLKDINVIQKRNEGCFNGF